MLIRRHNHAFASAPPRHEAEEQLAEQKGGRPAQDGIYAPPILMEIERWLKRTGMSPSRFGRLAVGDSALLHDLRAGRDPSSRTVARIRTFMDRNAEG
jgi:hypothetical protein